MNKNFSIWLAGLSTAALISGAALADTTTPAQKMDEAGAHTDAAAHQTTEAVKDAAAATGQAVDNATDAAGQKIENAADATGEKLDNAADATGEAVNDAAQATENAAETTGEKIQNAATAAGEKIQDAAAATGEAVQNAGESLATAANNAKDAVAERMSGDETGTPVAGQIFQQDADTFLASTLMDASITNMAGDTIGDVNDLVISSDGTVTGVVVGVGGFLGVGEKDVALEMSAVKITTDTDGDLVFSVNETEEALENAPAFVTAAEREAEMGRAGAATTMQKPAAAQ